MALAAAVSEWKGAPGAQFGESLCGMPCRRTAWHAKATVHSGFPSSNATQQRASSTFPALLAFMLFVMGKDCVIVWNVLL
jgi:hypothetical protein